ncbi:MAG: hypothetical protein MJ175_08070, partial [Clostridia bacterium]|nr:hypothetical protein [Clostridia bacterium]
EIPSDLGCKYRLSDVTAAPGDKVKLTMEAVRGKAPYTYQWQCRYTPNGRGRYTDWMNVDGLHIGGNTSSMYFYAKDSTFSEFYQYRCKITDATGAVVYSSTVSMIGKYAPLTVDIQPIDKNVSYGETTTFTVNVTGGLEPYTYCWRVSDNDGFRWTDIYGEKTSKLTVTGIYENLKYSCVVTDATGKSVSSPAAFLNVKNALRIASQPKNVAAVKGMSAIFEVTVAGGKSPYSYQWEYRYIPQGMADYTGWTKVGTWGAGAKSNSLAITVNSYEFDNAYQYRCVITDSAGNKLTTNTVYVTMK